MDNIQRHSTTQIRSMIDRANNKLKELKKDIIITTGIVFTSFKDYYYIFNVYQNNEWIDKIRANDSKAFDRVFKELTTKYEVNIIYDYTDLTYSQLTQLKADKKARVEPLELDMAYWDSVAK